MGHTRPQCSLFANREYFLSAGKLLARFDGILNSRIKNTAMRAIGSKQPVLKPQDLVVVLGVAIMRDVEPTFARLADALFISASEVHAAVQRSITSHLLEREYGSFSVNRASLSEFLLHGVRYAFPAVAGPVTRGLPTGVSAPPLREHFEHAANALPLVWPDAEGEVRGISICPLYPSVPTACRADPQLYRALALLDALRGGAAREREMAAKMVLNDLR